MPLKTATYLLDSLPRQVCSLPMHAKLLSVVIAPQFNSKLLLSTVEDDEKEKEKVEFVMLRVNEELIPANMKHVDSLKDNSGILHVFALRNSERLPMQPAIGAFVEVAK